MAPTRIETPLNVHHAGSFGALCGESPVWDHRENLLRWVDITAHQVNAFDPATGDSHSLTLDELVSAVLLEKAGSLLVATVSGLQRLDWKSGAIEFVHNPEPGIAGNRLNDCKADPAGTLFAGTMNEGAKQSSGALYRYGAQGVSRIVSGLTVSNGLAWSPDGARFYLVDSPLGRIYSFDYNAETGVLSDQRVFKEYGAGAGKPDGICTDCEGNLWVAFWGGARIECLRVDGALLHSVPMPVSQVTSLCFGGADMKTLFVTSARIGVKQPGLDGDIFALTPPVGGLLATEVRLAGVA
ncbi:SMP-30/gluconolactonase/LRE family protein [Thioclava indica]|uniref:SMP-30/Gluconolactonase/LRE-like region domain-containing protein n=1 Tax=Thioclava indica TaxID=1353528 RepID=A0A074J639_9RHOB|nr:SMP-30/gluconolactonase/LRE family protein [Thioclava indica]KEO51370.1 hypothetical protein DT23_08785 [Thioclava indica]